MALVVRQWVGKGHLVMKVRIERDRGMGSVVNLPLHSGLCHPFLHAVEFICQQMANPPACCWFRQRHKTNGEFTSGLDLLTRIQDWMCQSPMAPSALLTCPCFGDILSHGLLGELRSSLGFVRVFKAPFWTIKWQMGLPTVSWTSQIHNKDREYTSPHLVLHLRKGQHDSGPIPNV